MSVAIDSDTSKKSDLFKSAVPFVLVEELGNGIVGDEDVDATIAVEVCDRNSECVSGLCEPRLFCDFREMAITLVVVNERGNGSEFVGMTEGTVSLLAFSAPDIGEVPLQIA